MPTRYLGLLDDMSRLTEDVAGSVVAYFNMAQNHESMTEQLPQIESILHMLSNTQIDRDGKVYNNVSKYVK